MDHSREFQDRRSARIPSGSKEVAEKSGKLSGKQSRMELTFHPENMKIASVCKLLILRIALAIFRADPRRTKVREERPNLRSLSARLKSCRDTKRRPQVFFPQAVKPGFSFSETSAGYKVTARLKPCPF